MLPKDRLNVSLLCPPRSRLPAISDVVFCTRLHHHRILRPPRRLLQWSPTSDHRPEYKRCRHQRCLNQRRCQVSSQRDLRPTSQQNIWFCRQRNRRDRPRLRQKLHHWWLLQPATTLLQKVHGEGLQIQKIKQLQNNNDMAVYQYAKTVPDAKSTFQHICPLQEQPQQVPCTRHVEGTTIIDHRQQQASLKRDLRFSREEYIQKLNRAALYCAYPKDNNS